MRVPSIGLMPEERRIVAEGMELAERLLANYQEPTLGVIPTLKAWYTSARMAVLDVVESVRF